MEGDGQLKKTAGPLKARSSVKKSDMKNTVGKELSHGGTPREKRHIVEILKGKKGRGGSEIKAEYSVLGGRMLETRSRKGT